MYKRCYLLLKKWNDFELQLAIKMCCFSTQSMVELLCQMVQDLEGTSQGILEGARKAIVQEWYKHNGKFGHEKKDPPQQGESLETLEIPII